MSYHNFMMENQTMFSKMVFEQLADRKLTSGQPKILEYLLKKDGAIQRDIAAACQIEPATVTNLLFRMEKQHLVERKMVEGDRRYLQVCLTSCGKEEAECVVHAFDELEAAALDGFSQEEEKQFLEFLERVNRNLKERRKKK